MIARASIALCGQGLVYSLHIGQVLSREDTRNLTRDWMVAHIPRAHEDRRRAGRARRLGAGHRPPVAADRQRRPLGEVPDQPLADRPRRPASRCPSPGVIVNIEDYERTCARAGRRLRASGATAGSSPAPRSAAAPRPSPRSCPRRWPTTASSSAAPTSSTRPRRIAEGAEPVDVQLRLVRSTTTRWPTTGPGPLITVYRLRGGQLRAAYPEAVLVPRPDRHRPRAPRAGHRARAQRAGPRAPQPGRRRGGRRATARSLGRGLARRVRRPARRGRGDRRAAAAPTSPARRSTSRSSPAATRARRRRAPTRSSPPGIAPRRRRLRRPDREGQRPRPGHPARRGHRGRRRRRRRRAGRAARGWPTRPSASTPAPAGRGCCSSRR